MVKNYLGGSGFSMTIAPTGRAGLGLYDRQEFDALILDLMLPDMDGLEVCRKIRAVAQMPILMLAARATPWIGWSDSKSAPTIICQNRSSRASCWRGCAPFCGVPKAARSILN